jgi:hypothetical protein
VLVRFVGSTLPAPGVSLVLSRVVLALVGLQPSLFTLSGYQCQTTVDVGLSLVALDWLFFVEGLCAERDQIELIETLAAYFVRPCLEGSAEASEKLYDVV